MTAADTTTRSRRTRRLTIRAGVAAALGLGLVVVVPGGLGADQAYAAPLTAFEDCDELAGWFADASEPLLTTSEWRLPGAAIADESAPTAAAPGATGAGPTGTNVQEVGVDEPDLVKTDGTRVVTVRLDRLSVVDVSSPTPRLLGDLQLESGQAQELLLVGDRALVLGTRWDGPTGEAAAALTVVDLTDPSRPAIQRTEVIDGGYLSAREHDGTVRIVLASTPTLPFEYDDRFGLDSIRNRAIVDAAPAQSWLPQRVVRDAADEIVEEAPLLDCAQVSHPSEPAGLGVITVLTMDLRDPAAPMSEPVAVAADGDMVYASPDRLYVATTRGGWMFPQPIDIAPARAIETSVTTQLHGFDISDRTRTTYLASGSVDGWLLGRWALSAEGDYLRVATTRSGAAQDGQTDSAVTVLAEDGDSLTVVGSVGGLGRGEQVRAVRWFGDLATVVTFQQTDPLYTVDLSDPTTPRVLGELKITGYSAYLHPLGDGLLLGVGQEATSTGQVTGAKVTTFDLRDLSRPGVLDGLVEPGAWADVEGDSRAFTYLPDRRLAVTSLSGDRGSVLWAVTIGVDGATGTAGQWTVPGFGWLARAIPVDGGRMAVVTDTDRGPVLTVLDLDGLRPIGSVDLG